MVSVPRKASVEIGNDIARGREEASEYAWAVHSPWTLPAPSNLIGKTFTET